MKSLFTFHINGCCVQIRRPALGDGCGVEVARMNVACFPPAFATLPLRTQQEAIATVWDRIDESRGIKRPSLRLPTVRTRIDRPCVGWRSRLLTIRAKRAKLVSDVIAWFFPTNPVEPPMQQTCSGQSL